LIEIDGSSGEGGGQVVRTAVALGAVTGQPIRVSNVRARRDPPGLAPQHLAALQAVAALCSARCEGLALGSTGLTFVPGRLAGGEYAFDIGTAGSATLVLQALVPVLLCADAPSRVLVAGGTDVRNAPPFDYFQAVLLEWLRDRGARAAATAPRRGYYPRGGGVVEVQVVPGRPRPWSEAERGSLIGIDGSAHVGNLPIDIARRMREAAVAALGTPAPGPVAVEERGLGPELAAGAGGAVVLRARFARSVLGAARVAQCGVRAEAIGHAVGSALASDIATGAMVDVHLADQILVHLALAGGASSFTVRKVSMHAQTAMQLIAQLLPVRFSVTPDDGLVRIGVEALPPPEPRR
jgi:RNA 3'-phosphate cyclase